MTKKTVGWLAAAFVLGTLAVQVVDHVGHQTAVEAQLASAIRGYDGRSPEAFRDGLIAELQRLQVDVGPDGVQIEEDRAQDRVTVEVRYVATLRLLVVPVERTLVARRTAGLLR